jgi:hypothetical protein
LPLFFLKPAPVQATWLGYLGSTGVPTIDYRLTDRYTDPPVPSEAAGAEALWRLPLTQWCYRPYVEAPDVGPLPASTARGITFVCMNHPLKTSRSAFAVWARILAAVPASRLILLATPYDGQRARVLAFFAGEGIAGERIEQVGEAPIATYLPVTCAPTSRSTACPASAVRRPAMRCGWACRSSPWSAIGRSRSGASLLRNAELTELIARPTSTCARSIWRPIGCGSRRCARTPRSAARFAAARPGRLRARGRGCLRCDVGTRHRGVARMNVDVEVDLVPQPPPLLELRRISKHFVKPLDLPARIANLLGAGLHDEVVHAVDRVDLGIAEREVVGLVGESGCGKSTLGRIAVGMLPPTKGERRWRGVPAGSPSPRANGSSRCR